MVSDLRRRSFGLVIAGLVAIPAAGHAADAYWNEQCTNGGWAFNTCASAHVIASGNVVTVRIWNLAGLPGSSTFTNAGFTAVGLSSLGSSLTFKNLSAKYANGSTYAGWSFADGNGGIQGPVTSEGVRINGVGSAIFSQLPLQSQGAAPPG
jgi:hypothetical protein